MRLVRIGLGSVNTTVGAMRQHRPDHALAADMAADGVTLGVFQEQLVGGYPVEDLVQWQGFVDGQWTAAGALCQATAELPAVFVCGVSVMHNGLRYNCAAPVAGRQDPGAGAEGEAADLQHLLRRADVFPGRAGDGGGAPGRRLGDMLFRFDFGIVAVEVCEDLWSADGPIKRRTYSGAELSRQPVRLRLPRWASTGRGGS